MVLNSPQGFSAAKEARNAFLHKPARTGHDWHLPSSRGSLQRKNAKTSPGFEEGLRKCSIEVERSWEPVIFSKVLKDIKAGYGGTHLWFQHLGGETGGWGGVQATLGYTVSLRPVWATFTTGYLLKGCIIYSPENYDLSLLITQQCTDKRGQTRQTRGEARSVPHAWQVSVRGPTVWPPSTSAFCRHPAKPRRWSGKMNMEKQSILKLLQAEYSGYIHLKKWIPIPTKLEEWIPLGGLSLPSIW